MDLRTMNTLACGVLCVLWLASGVLFDDPHAITSSTVFAAAVLVLLGTRE